MCFSTSHLQPFFSFGANKKVAKKFFTLHCNENPVYVFPEMELSVPISTFMCLWAIYLFLGSVHIFYRSRIGRPIVGIYESLADTWMWKLGLRPRNSFPGNSCLEFSVLCLCLQCVGYSPYLLTCSLSWMSWLFPLFAHLFSVLNELVKESLLTAQVGLQYKQLPGQSFQIISVFR